MHAIAVALVAIISTLGGTYAAKLFATAAKSAAVAEEGLVVDIVKLEPISVPIVRQGKIEGYVIARVALSAPSHDVKNSKAVLMAYASEATFRAIYEDQVFDFAALKAANVAALAGRISKLANERIGRPTIKQALVESLNFVAKSEVRTQQGG